MLIVASLEPDHQVREDWAQTKGRLHRLGHRLAHGELVIGRSAKLVEQVLRRARDLPNPVSGDARGTEVHLGTIVDEAPQADEVGDHPFIVPMHHRLGQGRRKTERCVDRGELAGPLTKGPRELLEGSAGRLAGGPQATDPAVGIPLPTTDIRSSRSMPPSARARANRTWGSVSAGNSPSTPAVIAPAWTSRVM